MFSQESKFRFPRILDYQCEIEECKQRLAETDHVLIKITEKVATRKDYADIIDERAALRERVNALEILAEKQLKGENIVKINWKVRLKTRIFGSL